LPGSCRGIAEVVIEGASIIGLMRGALTEISSSLQSLRHQLDAADVESLPVAQNALLFSLDMNLAAIHMLGLRLMDGERSGRVDIGDSERVLIGMSGSLMADPIARLIDEALDGQVVTDDRVAGELGSEGPGLDGAKPLH
jgi:VIT1/CCC1 family predicted Fe2+/Mn2+ transporter